jgi:octaprenyl-diphosphate synthase
MVFQIVDDLLDYTEDEAMTGKPSGLDLREHKVTLPLIAALPRMSEAGRRDVNALMRSEEPDADQVARVVALVAEAGGLEYARERAQRWAEQADRELDHLPPSSARELLRSSVVYALERRR